MWCLCFLFEWLIAALSRAIGCPFSKYLGFLDARRQKKARALALREAYWDDWMSTTGSRRSRKTNRAFEPEAIDEKNFASLTMLR